MPVPVSARRGGVATAGITATAATAVIGSFSLVLTAGPAFAAGPALAAEQAFSERPTTPLSVAPTESRSLAGARAAGISRAVIAAPASSAYTIEPGDTISQIADRFDLRTSDVLAWNGLDGSDLIQPGQVILLAPAQSAPDAPGVASTHAGDSSASTAPLGVAAVHTVVGGDTLWAIARTGGVSLAALLQANALTDGSIIYPGQNLLVPATGGAAFAAATLAPAEEAATETASAPAAPLDEEQTANARIIIEVGRGLGVSDRGIAIALATAMVESWIRNLDVGDRDSLGLFQQRPSMGWGTAAQVRDPYRAATAFFTGAGDSGGIRTLGLLDIPDWQSMPFGAAAQAVQVSAHPDRYGLWEHDAYGWLAALG